MGYNDVLLGACLASGTCVLAIWAWSRVQQQKLETTRRPRAPVNCTTLFGVMGGLGPKASANFLDEGVVQGRVRLFHAMSQQEPTSQNDKQKAATIRFQRVCEASTAAWTPEEVELVHAQCGGRSQIGDQDHVPLVMYCNTQTPGRPSFIIGRSGDAPSPLPELAHTAECLARAGATSICIVCNTAHHFREDILAELEAKLPANCVPTFVDMLEVALEHVARQATNVESHINGSTSSFEEDVVVVGLLATRATLETRIFEKTAARMEQEQQGAGHQQKLIILTPLSTQALACGARQDAIEEALFGSQGIKTGFDSVGDSNDTAALHNLCLLLEQALILKRAGAQSVVLGCTELPLLLNEKTIREFAVLALEPCADRDDLLDALPELVLVNPTRTLADEVIRATLLGRTGEGGVRVESVDQVK
jgi:aspartate racemase